MTTQNPRYSYAIGSGWNVALASLTNLENLSQFVVRGNPVPVSTQPVNLFPIVRVAGSGKPKGYGRVDHAWTWSVLPQAAIQYLEDTFFSSGTVVSAQVTINTRRQNRGTYTRYNAYAQLLIPTVNYTYRQNMFVGVTMLFYGLTASS